MPKKSKGGIEDISDSGFGSLSRGLSGLMNSGTLRGLAKKRVGDSAPAAKKASPSMNRSQMAASAKSMGGSMNPDGTFNTKGAAKKPAAKGMGGHRGK